MPGSGSGSGANRLRNVILIAGGVAVAVAAIVLVLVLVLRSSDSTNAQQDMAQRFIIALEAKDAHALIATLDATQTQALGDIATAMSADAAAAIAKVADGLNLSPGELQQRCGGDDAQADSALAEVLTSEGRDWTTFQLELRLANATNPQDFLGAIFFDYRTIRFDGVTFATSVTGDKVKMKMTGGTIAAIGLDGKAVTMDATQWMAGGGINLIEWGDNWYVDLRVNIRDWLTVLGEDRLAAQWTEATTLGAD